MRFLLTIFVFISLLFFPWPFSAILTIGSSFFIPFLPLAAGIFADTLYYTHKTEAVPFLTIYGAITTGIALFVRSQLSSDIIKK